LSRKHAILYDDNDVNDLSPRSRWTRQTAAQFGFYNISLYLISMLFEIIPIPTSMTYVLRFGIFAFPHPKRVVFTLIITFRHEIDVKWATALRAIPVQTTNIISWSASATWKPRKIATRKHRIQILNTIRHPHHP